MNTPINLPMSHIQDTLHKTIKYETKRLPHSSPRQYSQRRKWNNCQKWHLSLWRTKIWNKRNKGNRSNYMNKKVPTIHCSGMLLTKTQSDGRRLYTTFLKSLGEKFILGGDFNAKHTHWGTRLVTTRGTKFLNAVIERGCNCHTIGKPTYWPTDVNQTSTYLISSYSDHSHNTTHSQWQINLKAVSNRLHIDKNIHYKTNHLH